MDHLFPLYTNNIPESFKDKYFLRKEVENLLELRDITNKWLMNFNIVFLSFNLKNLHKDFIPDVLIVLWPDLIIINFGRIYSRSILRSGIFFITRNYHNIFKWRAEVF